MCSEIDKKDEELTREDLRNNMACIGFVEGVVEGISVEASYVKLATGKGRHNSFACLPRPRTGSLSESR